MILPIILALIMCGFFYILGYEHGINKALDLIKKQIDEDILGKSNK